MSRLTSIDSHDLGSAIDTASLASPKTVGAWIRNALAVRRQRRALLALDSRMLADIGLSEADAWREASRSMFDVNTSLRHR